MNDPIYTVGLIGHGIVGKGVHKLLDDYVLAIYDPQQGYDQKSIFKNLDIAVICVPTETSDDGMSCDTKIVEESCLWLNQIDFKGVILIKSTTAPSKLIELSKTYKRIVYSPEFLGESKYYTPPWKYPDPKRMQTHTWQIFGGSKKDTSFCVDVFQRKMGVDTKYFQTDIQTASLVKYAFNSFASLKITFFNELYDICQLYGVDYNELRTMLITDPRMNPNHTLVFKKDRGYGGKCFPKDTKAFIADARKMGYIPELLEAVDKVNTKIRGTK